ncbi:MAG TPA: ATP-binding cassette domain-containing protein [Candidatus Polarisedimenticolaceae bacterium]|nr:ATP-binding cassette domain-containing protein [Candidatus Polarisedimenticolaceae bacterium]
MSTAIVESTSSSPVTIRAEGLRHVYKGGTVALDGVDLEFGTGLFGLLGPNGAGKSTLMRIMCTLLVPTAGRVTVGGHDVCRERLAVRRLLGYLPQEFGGWRLQRVEEVLDTLAILSGMRDRSRRRGRIAEVLRQVGLDEVADRKVKKLSGGMVRRLGVAQALVHEPRVLIVDEPTVGLDPQERLRFRQLMASLGQDRTIVLSTHIVADLGSSCRDLALIDGGKIVFRGSPEELMSQARGRVFQLAAGGADLAAVEQRYEVVSSVRDGEVNRVRAVSRDGRLPDGAQPVDDPTLEEAYLAFMAARGRSDALSAEESER